MPAVLGTLAVAAAASGALALPNQTGIALASEVALSPLPAIDDALADLEIDVLNSASTRGAFARGNIRADGAAAVSATEDGAMAVGRVATDVREASLSEQQVDAATDLTRVKQVVAARKTAAEKAARAKKRKEVAAARAAAAAEAKAEAAEAKAEAAAEAKRVAAAKTTAVPTSNYSISAEFGSSGNNWSSTHTGLDFAAPGGTPVVASASGTVTEAGYAGAYGNRIIVTHNDGTETWYCHLSSIVRGSGAVGAGETIGHVGSTGNSTGNHLHFEVHPGGGSAVNPMSWLLNRGADL